MISKQHLREHLLICIGPYDDGSGKYKKFSSIKTALLKLIYVHIDLPFIKHLLQVVSSFLYFASFMKKPIELVLLQCFFFFGRQNQCFLQNKFKFTPTPMLFANIWMHNLGEAHLVP